MSLVRAPLPDFKHELNKNQKTKLKIGSVISGFVCFKNYDP